MASAVYLEAYSTITEYQNQSILKLPLESYITYLIFTYCEPHKFNLYFVYQTIDNYLEKDTVSVIWNSHDRPNFLDISKVPWQVSSCLYPIVIYEDTVITGLCAVARSICKFKSLPKLPQEHEEGLLGFRKSCLQAPNEVSIWTKFCEIDLVKTVKGLLRTTDEIKVIPKDLVRFENHLSKPVRVHNIYKVARDLKTAATTSNLSESQDKSSSQKNRVCKPRKWKSNLKKDNLVECCSAGIDKLSIYHQFAEGPFLTLADLIIVPSYYLLIQYFSESIFKSLLPLTYNWYFNIIEITNLKKIFIPINEIQNKRLILENITIPTTENVSLYKCDPKRHNPKKRLFTKEQDVENALSLLQEGVEISVSNNEYKVGINWKDIPSGANPNAGHLPDKRIDRKSQQLENMTLAVLRIAKAGDKIVDFCSGSGHLGILIAYLLPKCTIILLENKEQSLFRARERVHEMGLNNVYFFQCNLDFFVGHFDIGIALHACGIASDLVLDKSLQAKAKFVICPCCYGSLHVTDRLNYPRSKKFNIVPVEQYMCIGHAADQTHEEHPLTIRGIRCMVAIDSDRAHLAEEFGYKVTLCRLKPPSCTPKNNLLIGVPS